MVGASSSSFSSSAKSITNTGVRIVVVGNRGTGKSSMIMTAAANFFPTNVPSVLSPIKLPEDMFPDRVPVTIIDTCHSEETREETRDELTRADAVVLTCAFDQPSSLDRLTTFWLPTLELLNVRVPVIVCGCKCDLMNKRKVISLEQVMSPIMQRFRNIEKCIDCSAYKHTQIEEVFIYAKKAVIHPRAPLFDQEAQTLKPRCVRALKRIFILCDHDRDGALSDAELNYLQVKCFNAPMPLSELDGVKQAVQEKLPEGVNENGLTLTGFLSLHTLFIEKGRPEKTWTVLRKFGYNNSLRLLDDQLLPPIKRTPDQSVELRSEAVEFLKRVFSLFDMDGDGALHAHELEDVFSTAPESPWSEAPYANAVKKNALGGLSLDGFLSEWALMTLLDPVLSVENLICIGYRGDPSSAVRVTLSRRVDPSDRNVFHCFVFGPKESGKTSMLNSFVGRPFSEVYTPTTEERYTVNIVDQPDGTKKTLILREIPEDEIEKLLIHKDALAACDLAVFVHDSSNESSWNRTKELLVQVASQSTGYEVPCLIVAAKYDLHPCLTAIQDITRVSHDMRIAAPIPISTKLGAFNDVFIRIVRAAQHPHLSFPETKACKNQLELQLQLSG